MSSSTVTLFYGLWVKTWSLAFAADAHDKIHSTLLAIDLLCLRRRKGELVAEGGEAEKTAVDLPVEVWDLVKQRVIDEVLSEVEQAALCVRRCEICAFAVGDITSEVLQSRGFDIKNITIDKAAVWRSWTPPNCQDCRDILEGCGHLWWFDTIASENRADALLRSYGLRLVSDESIRDPDLGPDFDELSPVALPLETSPHCRLRNLQPTAIASLSASSSATVVWDVSAEALSLPSNADLRFHRLISAWHLVVKHPPATTISHLPATSDAGTEAQEVSSEAEDEPKFADGEPRWMLWTFGESR